MTESPLNVDLRPEAVGYRFATPRRTVSEEDVRRFAELTGDRHPQHVDDRWAASSPFGQRIAHGMLVVSFAMGLVPMDSRRVIALRRCEAVFKQPVRLGEGICVNGQLTGVKPLDDRHVLASWKWRIVNDEGGVVVRIGIDVLWRNLNVGDDPHAPRIAGVVPL